LVLRTENDKNREKVESPSHALARLLDCDAGGAEQHKEAKMRRVIIATALLVTSCSVYMAAHQPDKKDLVEVSHDYEADPRERGRSDK
jgi:hypothetical protein